MKDTKPTLTIFRKHANGEILALFPLVPEQDGLVSSYLHCGQHGAADYGHCIATTKPASPAEYKELQEELEGLGYVVKIGLKMPNKPRSNPKPSAQPSPLANTYNPIEGTSAAAAAEALAKAETELAMAEKELKTASPMAADTMAAKVDRKIKAKEAAEKKFRSAKAVTGRDAASYKWLNDNEMLALWGAAWECALAGELTAAK